MARVSSSGTSTPCPIAPTTRSGWSAFGPRTSPPASACRTSGPRPSPALDDAERKSIVARGAAQLAARRTPEGQPATPEQVMAVEFEEFALLLAADQARTALREADRARG
ncbi:hypothetical protein [Streptomyces sp. NPDC055243]|uniref:hypothetical protein n=1 Tax=Streptomyces sp. NPDC055243 TaxID=3365720 RepID=UPI0037D5DAA5